MNDEATKVIGTDSADPAAVTRVPDRTPATEPRQAAPPEPPTAAQQETRLSDRPAAPAAPNREPDPAAPPPVADPTPAYGIPPGTLLANTYRVERMLGGGGMGEVYLTRDERVGVQHAVKVIRPSMAANRQVMDLFYREAKVLRGVRHDAVVSYDGFVRDAEGRDYLVMEYVDGPSLGERLRRGPLPVDEILTLRDRLAAGLAEAHRKGAVHRDLSPDNVILPGNQVAAAKLIDFGLSKLTDPTQETIIGSSFAGKYRFASPEQFGLCGGAVDGRSDIYSLGLILAAAALGRPLAMGESFADALGTRQRVPDLTGIPQTLHPWLAAMLDPDPARRPADLDALLTHWPAATRVDPLPRSANAGAKASEPVRTPAPNAAPAARRSPRVWLLSGGALALAAVAAGIYVALQPLEPVSPPATATHPGPTTETRPTPPVPATSEPGAPATPAGNLEQLIAAHRDDAALSTAQSLIAARSAAPAASAQPLPTGAFLALADQLRTAGRPQDAFILAEALISAGETPPIDTLWPLAQDLRTAGRLDPWFFLVRNLANRSYGPASFAMGEMYDPQHWSASTSPLAKPRADKAREWYEQALRQGVREAGERLEALKSL
ncbi:serine/threonine-protein kinase [uncultured Lamprocystis sp.]|jgi:serine/threonine-protein kinase|uniref:serine/threonine-protein kinase n=1 Tax=uncultured Lamprocystis sp. TaxID=543132 RepID=UPI0025DDAC3F|nr:serine/threonine-protein kinase [uncultured Lamprocystis sp.]